MRKKHDFFISYNHRDEAFAKWISWILEDAGYNVFVQAWDFRPGHNIVLKMQEGAADADCTIALLSNNYMLSQFTQPEWAAAFGADPTGKTRKLIPILIEDFKLEGLLPQISYISLVGKEQDEAKQAILNGVQLERAKPVVPPPFPGLVQKKQTESEDIPQGWYNPWLDKRVKELENGQFNDRIPDGAKIALHLLPIESISTNKRYEIKEINNPLNLKPFFTTGWDYTVNKDGYLTFAKWPSDNYPHSYVQFYRNGIIESVDMGMLKERSGEKYIPIAKLEKDIVESIKQHYLKALKAINVKLPIAVSITLLDIKDYYLAGNFGRSRETIDQTTLRLPAVLINSWDDDIAKTLKPSFDLLWNHFGYEQSLNYSEDGTWRETRGF